VSCELNQDFYVTTGELYVGTLHQQHNTYSLHACTRQSVVPVTGTSKREDDELMKASRRTHFGCTSTTSYVIDSRVCEPISVVLEYVDYL
jgi:hypothetical protein